MAKLELHSLETFSLCSSGLELDKRDVSVCEIWEVERKPQPLCSGGRQGSRQQETDAQVLVGSSVF